MESGQAQTPTADFVDALLRCGGQLTLIINHMASYPSSDGAEPFDDVLRRLFTETLQRNLTVPPAELRSAAEVLAKAVDIIGEEIYLVPPGGPPPNRAERRARRRRRGH